MHRFIYKISLLVSIIAMVSAFLNGVSIPTSVFRGALIFLGTMLLFILLLNLMRWAITSTTVIDAVHQAKEEEERKEGAKARDKLQGKMIQEIMKSGRANPNGGSQKVENQQMQLQDEKGN